MSKSETGRTLDHPCDACGGSGCKCGKMAGHFDCDFCPVCLGSGRISDRMPVSDAVADAETLMLEACDTSSDGILLDAEDYGLGAAEATKSGDDMWSGNWAEHAARAAFRAVPGLREEK